MPQVTIDNRTVEVTPGSNLLAAARKLRIDIPALCYHPACPPNTSCMACVVKLKNPDRIVPACATPATDGMVVESETAELHALRRTALELLLSDHAGAAGAPGYPTCDCDKREVCRLRKYAQLYNADPRRFAGTRRATPPVQTHPELTYDPAKCILCGICVELTRQIGEPLGLTLIGRGFDVVVATPFDEPLAKALQTAARRCAGACPTGALTPRK